MQTHIQLFEVSTEIFRMKIFFTPILGKHLIGNLEGSVFVRITYPSLKVNNKYLDPTPPTYTLHNCTLHVNKGTEESPDLLMSFDDQRIYRIGINRLNPEHPVPYLGTLDFFLVTDIQIQYHNQKEFTSLFKDKTEIKSGSS